MKKKFQNNQTILKTKMLKYKSFLWSKKKKKKVLNLHTAGQDVPAVTMAWTFLHTAPGYIKNKPKHNIEFVWQWLYLQEAVQIISEIRQEKKNSISAATGL